MQDRDFWESAFVPDAQETNQLAARSYYNNFEICDLVCSIII